MPTLDYPLANGLVALIDEADLPLLDGRSWHHVKTISGKIYAAADASIDGKTVRTYMHRLFLGVHLQSRPLIDHRDGNGLNNTRLNLRPATSAQNAQNRDVDGRYRGVFAASGGYIARAGGVYGGLHATKTLAALAYDEIAQRVYGDGARLNFPPVGGEWLNARFLGVQ